jgi:hypothetical protein
MDISAVLRSVLSCIVFLLITPACSQTNLFDFSLPQNIFPIANIYPRYAVASENSKLTHFVLTYGDVGAEGCRNASAALASLNTTIQRFENTFRVQNAYFFPALSGPADCYGPYAIPLGELGIGKYTADLIPLNGPYSRIDYSGQLSTRLTFAVLSLDQAKKGVIEIPAEASVQTGIGLISGWSCIADNVEISIDGGPRQKVPTEAPRGDVESVCAHPNAGFGLLTNFNLLKEGDHTIQLYAKGVALGDVRKFKTVKPKGEFATGLRKEVSVADFPEPGKTTILEWRESEQRFAMKSVQ